MREIAIAELESVSGAGEYCGPQGGWMSNFIPDRPLGFDFTSACAAHDVCYGLAVDTRATCDNVFRQDMYQTCDGNVVCERVADVYAWSVETFGSAHYGGIDSPWAGLDSKYIQTQHGTC
jgi:Prokaryotic phospholipase A2